MKTAVEYIYIINYLKIPALIMFVQKNVEIKA